MARAVGLFSTKKISPSGVQRIMELLKAVPDDDGGWRVTKDDRRVFVDLCSEDLEFVDDEVIMELSRELGGIPVSMVSLVFDDSKEDRFEFRLARAVGIAFADHYPVVFHDYVNPPETLQPPGIAGPTS